MTKKYEFDVKMTCGGCSGAVNRALSKAEGIEKYDVSLETQKVVVVPGTATFEYVEEKIKKTGKEVRSGKVVDDEEEGTSAAPSAPAEVVA